jgi:hypothetical protein
MCRVSSVVLTGALLAAGCSGSGTSPTPTGPLRLSAIQLPAVVVNGEPLTSFVAQVENIGQTAVDLTFPSSCQILPAFQTRAGQPVIPAGGGFACATVIINHTLRPGESISQNFRVKVGSAPEGQSIVLPPGDYRIVVQLADTVYRLNSDPLSFTLR